MNLDSGEAAASDSGAEPVRSAERAIGFAGVLVVGSVLVAFLFVAGPQGVSGWKLWIGLVAMFAVLSVIHFVLAKRFRRGWKIRLRDADAHFDRIARVDPSPHKDLAKSIPFLKKMLPSAGWVIGDDVLIFTYQRSYVPDAAIMALATGDTPPAWGGVILILLPHELFGSAAEDLRSSRAVLSELPAQDGASWTLYSKDDCYQVVSRPRIIAELSKAPAGEVWGWHAGRIFCLWPGPLSADRMRDLNERVQALVRALGEVSASA